MSDKKPSKTVRIDYDLMYEYVATAMRAIDQEEPEEFGEAGFGARVFTHRNNENNEERCKPDLLDSGEN